LSYDTIYLIAKAIERAKGGNPKKIRNELYKTDYTGAAIHIAFQQNGEPIRELIPVIVKEGKIVRYFR